MNLNQIAELISWPLQVMILAAAIYLFLRVLSTARGSGLMRGLVVAALFGLIGIAGLSELLELEEISKLVEDFTPSIAVILAILFQPELRRIVSQLGEQNKLGRLIGQTRDEALPEVVQALSAMASRNTGALIAFERDLALDEWTQNAVRLDSAVNRLALESIFHPGASLHDGAVVIRGDRILAAACLFPLTENTKLPKSTGTRHRAALGLTEETDAVTVVVSEETGEIAIAKRGKMQRGVAIESLEKVLREKLELSAEEGSGAAAAAKKGLRGTLSALGEGLHWLFTQDLTRKVSAMAMAAGLLWIAHREIAIEEKLELTFLPIEASEAPTFDEAGLVGVILPERAEGPEETIFHLSEPQLRVPSSVVLRGSRNRVTEIMEQGLSGTFDARDLEVGATIELDVDDISGSWTSTLGVTSEWAEDSQPFVRIEAFERISITLNPDHIQVVDENGPEFYEAKRELADFTPDAITLFGPKEVIATLRSEERKVEFDPIVLERTDRDARDELLRLAPSLIEMNVTVAGEEAEQIAVRLPILPIVKEIGVIEKEIALVNLNPVGSDLESSGSAWQLPALDQTRRFLIQTQGLFAAGADQNSDSWIEQTSKIRRYVDENLRVFVDVSAMNEASRRVPVQWAFARDWRLELGLTDPRYEGADLTVELEAGSTDEPEILLEAREMSTLEGAGTGGSPPKNGSPPPGERE